MHYCDEPVVTLRGLRSVTLRVPEVTTSKDFYTEVWGLGLTEEDGDRFWLRGTGQEHHILKLEEHEANSLGGVSFAVATPREVDEAGRRLVAAGIPLLREPGRLDDAAGGYGLAFVDPEGRVVELASEVHAVAHQDRDGYPSV